MVATQNNQFLTTQQPPYFTTPPQFNSSTWLDDSGCNAHVTADLVQLATSAEYNGEDNIAIGNDKSLPITHTGCGTLPYNSCSPFVYLTYSMFLKSEQIFYMFINYVLIMIAVFFLILKISLFRTINQETYCSKDQA